MENSNNNAQVPDRDALDRILTSDCANDQKAWALYRFIKANVGEKLSSQDCRSLLSQYFALNQPCPSLLHSLMLNVATKMADAYPDFMLSKFLEIWNLANLRTDDYQRQTDKEGHSFHSITERLASCILRRMIANPEEIYSEAAMALAREQSQSLGYLPIMPMIAVKMFETEQKGRKIRMVKLVGPKGEELATDWHAFHAKPWEIVGRMYRVLPRRSEKSGNVRVEAIGQAVSDIADEFGRVIGFVDSYDEKHKHYHIFDPVSRHFVAESPTVRMRIGDYVWFAPAIPAVDPFKTAVVLSVEAKDTGRESFGALAAKVTHINTEKGYFSYATADGQSGFGNLKAANGPLSVGQQLRMTTYLRRGSNGEKRLHIGEAY